LYQPLEELAPATNFTPTALQFSPQIQQPIIPKTSANKCAKIQPYKPLEPLKIPRKIVANPLQKQHQHNPVTAPVPVTKLIQNNPLTAQFPPTKHLNSARNRTEFSLQSTPNSRFTITQTLEAPWLPTQSKYLIKRLRLLDEIEQPLLLQRNNRCYCSLQRIAAEIDTLFCLGFPLFMASLCCSSRDEIEGTQISVSILVSLSFFASAEDFIPSQSFLFPSLLRA
jgi:hypothetical protein